MMERHIHMEPRTLRSKIRRGLITLGGNGRLKIYGRLHCKSGKRMKRENRVLFGNEIDAWNAGYRPCGHCMRKAYQKWKK